MKQATMKQTSDHRPVTIARPTSGIDVADEPSTDRPAESGVRASMLAPGWFHAARRASLVVAGTLVGLAAGFFFTYQFSIVPALAEVDDVVYVETFQSINDTIRNAPFGIVFFGTIPALCAALALHARATWRRRNAIIVALIAYVAVFAITATANVPLNDELGLVTERTSAALADARGDFEGAWNRLNLARALLSAASLVAVVVAAVSPAGDD
ncbi:MAG: DUF1772 domain-containing protein [Actinomycetota bacterium]